MPKKRCPPGKRPSKTNKKTCVRKRKSSLALAKWREAAKAEGYLKAGAGFKPLPKSGSPAHAKILARYKKM